MWTFLAIIIIGAVIIAVFDRVNGIKMSWKNWVREIYLMGWGGAICVQVYIMTH